MSLNKQFDKIRENWLILVLIVGLLFFSSGFQGFDGSMSKSYAEDYAVSNERAIAPYYGDDFAPGVEERRISYSSNIDLEIERGDFDEVLIEIKSIASDNSAIITNQNVNSFGDGFDERKVGYTSVKVPLDNYESLLEAFKSLGEVESFNENELDVTGSYINTLKELELERERLNRYNQILNELDNSQEKVLLVDKILEQERRIVYLEESLERNDNLVEYATVYLSMQEEESLLARIDFIGLQEIIREFVNSINSVILLVFVIIPYLIAFLLIWFVLKVVRK